MQTLTRPKTLRPNLRSPRSKRRRFSPYWLIGTTITLLVLVGTGIYTFASRPTTGTHAANVAGANPNCTLIVPSEPLTAQGLATPYRLQATDAGNGPCHEGNTMQSAFVQAAVFDPATGHISVYNPLVIDKGTKPAMAPVVPQLPAGAVVGIWFGFNGAVLTLKSTQNGLQAGNCVNGIRGSIFGQFAYCNAPAFFQAANQAIAQRKLVPPPLGMGKDGMVCPTVRDFGIVDQDQSDNVTTAYLVTGKGRVAQLNATNAQHLQDAQILTNGSDNRLLDIAVDDALGCKPWMVNDLADPGHVASALPLNELQAAMYQGAPVALVPPADPMVLVNTRASLNKVNAYRIGVDQPELTALSQDINKQYCTDLLNIGPARIFKDAFFTKQFVSPDPAAANSLFTFLAQRFNTSWNKMGGLNCRGLLKQKSPIKVKTDGNGVAIEAKLSDQALLKNQVLPNNNQATTPGNQALPSNQATTPGNQALPNNQATTPGNQAPTPTNQAPSHNPITLP